MKFNYKLERLCGPVYGPSSFNTTKRSGGGANLLFSSNGNILYTPVSNRIQVIDLIQHSIHTLPFQSRSDITRIALSPDECLLLICDEEYYGMLVNVNRVGGGGDGSSGGGGGVGGVVLHRFHFQKPVRSLKFSPCGYYFAVSYGNHVRVWYCPRKRCKEITPFVLHRTYTGCTNIITQITWSDDSSVIMGGSNDYTIRLWTLHTTDKFVPITLAGHKSSIVGCYFAGEDGGDSVGSVVVRKGHQINCPLLKRIYTISSDGAVFTWIFEKDKKMNDDDDDDDDVDETHDPLDSSSAIDFFTGSPKSLKSTKQDDGGKSNQAHGLLNGNWKIEKKHYIHPKGHEQSKITACSMNAKYRNTLVLGFSSGIFGLYEMPSVANIHTLSISDSFISTVDINSSSEWLAFGCPTRNQLLVWEWRSETYIIKQQGHGATDSTNGVASGIMRKMAYSPDSSIIATGGEDGSIKLWNVNSGFCFVTFRNHLGPITDIQFKGGGSGAGSGAGNSKSSVVLSSSLDGTVRAHDLIRYRNFRTLTSPSGNNVQFTCMAVDSSGEIVAAGTCDDDVLSHDIYLWNLQTGRILDILSGHSSPISCLSFHPRNGGYLGSSSWDGSMKLWNVYNKDTVGEALNHKSDVVCMAFRPDGEMVCTGTLSGTLQFWKLDDASLVHVIEGQKDISGGRKMNDRMTFNNNASSRYFTSVCYTADGSCVLAGGNSKFICIYEISQQILIKKFQISYNRTLDGVLDELNSKNLGDGGPMDTMENSDNDDDDNNNDNENNTSNNLKNHLPGVKRLNDVGSSKHRPEILSSQVSFSYTGREFAFVSIEGLHIYTIDDDLIFDPILLNESITPSKVLYYLRREKNFLMALIMSIHLNEMDLIIQVLEEVPYSSIEHVVKGGRSGGKSLIGPQHLKRFMEAITYAISNLNTPHLQFYLKWCTCILRTHGRYMSKYRSKYMSTFRSMFKAIHSRNEELKLLCNENCYNLQFMEEQGRLVMAANNANS